MKETKLDLIKTLIIGGFSLLGFILTIKLAVIYYEANFVEYALPSFCSINDFVTGSL